MEAATEAFMLMVVGLEVGDENQKIQRMCGGMSNENMRQALEAKENEGDLEVEETVDGSMMSAETDGCGFHSLLYLRGPSWWFRMSVFSNAVKAGIAETSMHVRPTSRVSIGHFRVPLCQRPSETICSVLDGKCGG